MTSVKDQDSLEICWSYGTIAAIESSLLAHGQVSSPAKLDLSERQLAYFTFNLVPDKLGNTIGDENIPTNRQFVSLNCYTDNYIQNWGNAWLTTQTLASGIGAVDESYAPTQSLINEWNAVRCRYTKKFQEKTNLSSNLARDVNAWRLSSAKRIPMKNTSEIKRAIIENGGVATLTYLDYWDGASWEEDNAAFYNYEVDESNHLITIVGWDDDYSVDNFDSWDYPDENGAWLCKNSWGTDWGDRGYYWISYEDYYFNNAEVAAYAYEMKPASKEEILYQYDGAAGDCYKTIPSGGSIANLFTAKGAGGRDEVLKSVSLTMLYDVDVNYTIQIYTDCTNAANPTSGKPALDVPLSGRTTCSGIYNIPLNKEVTLKSGSKFAVVATLSHDNKSDVKYDIDANDTFGDWVKFNSAVAPNQSFARKRNTAGWEDLSKLTCDCDDEEDPNHNHTNCVARIKAISEPVKSVNPYNQMGEGGSPIGKGASAKAAEKAIISSTSEEGPAGSKFAPLRLRSTKQGKNNISLTWSGVKGASRYVIYGNACGKTRKMKRLGTVSGKSFKIKKINRSLKKGTYHKFVLVALDANDRVVTTSKVVHVATKGSKKIGNPTKVTVKKPKALKKGKKHKLRAKQVGKKVKKHRAVSYESSNAKVAKVTKKGVIKAVGKGSCYVYAYAQNGIFKKVKVTVK